MTFAVCLRRVSMWAEPSRSLMIDGIDRLKNVKDFFPLWPALHFLSVDDFDASLSCSFYQFSPIHQRTTHPPSTRQNKNSLAVVKYSWLSYRFFFCVWLWSELRSELIPCEMTVNKWDNEMEREGYENIFYFEGVFGPLCFSVNIFVVFRYSFSTSFFPSCLLIMPKGDINSFTWAQWADCCACLKKWWTTERSSQR